MRMVIDACWRRYLLGIRRHRSGCLEKSGTLWPGKTIQNITKNNVALKGPTTTPIGTGHEIANVTLRKVFDLYTNVRPIG